MESKRKHTRVPLIHHFRVDDLRTGERIGYLGNLTTSGIMLYTEQEVQPQEDRIYPLLLTVPRMATNQSIFVPSRCIWCRKHEATGLYAVGFAIDGIGTRTCNEIHQLIHSFGCGRGVSVN